MPTPSIADQMAQAVRFHQQGDLARAERFYAKVLQASPDQFDALLMAGILKFQKGEHQPAHDRLAAATEANPASPIAWLNLGVVLEALKRGPEAVASYDRALALEPGYAEAHFNRANVLQASGRHAEALAGYERAIGLRPNLVQAYNNRGTVLQGLGRHADALASFERALALAPDFPDAHDNRGCALRRLKRPADALAAHDRAIALRPDFAEAHTNRGNTLLELERPAQALASHDKALALAPEHAGAHNNRGSALLDLNRFEEALASYDRALVLQPEFPDALSNRGNALKELRRLDQARSSYERALALAPAHPDALYNRGHLDLLTGNLAAGWAGFEHRWRAQGLPKRRLPGPCPEWAGEELGTKRIAVLDEMGLGDTIQFARYLKLLVGLGALPTLLTRSPLLRLLGTVDPAARVVDAAPTGETFDFQIALLSLPRVLGTTLQTIPATGPYLAAEPALIARWRAALPQGGLNIGIAWQGNPKAKIDLGRSMPLSCFAPLARVPGVRLVSLQKTHGLDQLASLPDGMRVHTLGEDFDSGPDAFLDTAAVMASLDLVVTSDTSIAHLAGALGRPVWVVLRHVPDWRWLLDREDSPWYPSMRLFRQSEPGAWQEVLERIAAAARSLGSRQP